MLSTLVKRLVKNETQSQRKTCGRNHHTFDINQGFFFERPYVIGLIFVETFFPVTFHPSKTIKHHSKVIFRKETCAKFKLLIVSHSFIAHLIVVFSVCILTAEKGSSDNSVTDEGKTLQIFQF